MWYSLVGMFKTFIGWIMLGLSEMLSLGHFKLGLSVLLFVFLLDFATGIWASAQEIKQSGRRFNLYDFQSKKVRLSITKALTYICFILFSWLFYLYMFDKSFPMPGSTKSFTVPEITLGVCIAVECWSNIENCKRAGYDILGKIRMAARKLWSTFNTIKTGKSDDAED